MNQYFKYILLIILGIILFTLLNNRENFSIGNQLYVVVDNEKIKIKTYPRDDDGRLIKCRGGSKCTLNVLLTISNSISKKFPKQTISDVSEYLEEYEQGMSDFIESKFLKEGLVELDLVDKDDDSKIDTITLFKETITIHTKEKELKTFRDGIEYMFEDILINGTALIVGLTFLIEGIAQAHSVIFYKESEESYWFIDPTVIAKNFNVTNIKDFLTKIHEVNPDYYFIKLDYKSAELNIKGKNIINNPIDIERLPEDKYWEELRLKERMAADTLGVDSEEKWERYNEYQNYRNWTGKSWDQLNSKEKRATDILKLNKYDFILNPTTSSEEEEEEEKLEIGDECNSNDWWELGGHIDRCISNSGTCEAKSPDEDLCDYGQCFCYGTEGADCIVNNPENKQKYGTDPRLSLHQFDLRGRMGVTPESGHPQCANDFKCIEGKCRLDSWDID